MKLLRNLPLLGFALVACWLSPVFAQESIDSHEPHRTIWLHPNGVDDTSALQGALDSCSGIRCVIRLAAGVFHTAPLVANDFHGVMRGAGQHDTIVQTLTDRVLHLSQADPFNVLDPTPQEPWPAVMTFIEGDVRLSNLTIQVPEGTVTDGWRDGRPEAVPVLGAGVLVSGREPMKFASHHVSFVGAPHPDPFWSENLIGGEAIAGFLLPENFQDPFADIIPVEGVFSVESSHHTGMRAGTTVLRIDRANIRIIGNTYDDIARDVIEPWDVGHSEVYIADNDISVLSGSGIFVFQNGFSDSGLPLFEQSDFTVVNNRVRVADGGFVGIRYFDVVEGAAPSQLNILRNEVEMGVNTFTGIGVGQIDDVRIAKNTVSGSPVFGVGVELSTGCRVHLNDFAGLTPLFGDIGLDVTTDGCRVTAFNGDTVLDFGTNNKVIFR